MIQDEWVKSSFSNGNGGNNCIEIMKDRDGDVWLRDSETPDTVIVFEQTDWAVFMQGVKAGEFD